jgi:hypothetical protein
LIDLDLQGRLPLEKFVSERIGLGDIEETFHKMHEGKVPLSVVVLHRPASTRSSPPTATIGRCRALATSLGFEGTSHGPRRWHDATHRGRATHVVLK